MKRHMRQTSLQAYRELDNIGRRQRLVYDGIKTYPNITAMELCRKLGRLDPNFVRPRINELAKLKLVTETGKRECSITKRRALTWANL